MVTTAMSVNVQDFYFLQKPLQFTFYNPAVTVCTASFNITKQYILLTVYFYVLNLRIMPCRPFDHCFLQTRWQVFTARYEMDLYIEGIMFRPP